MQAVTKPGNHNEAAHETEPTRHVSETREAWVAWKIAETRSRRGQIRPQVTSKPSAHTVATKQRAGQVNNQQPEDEGNARSGEAPKVQEKGYAKIGKNDPTENEEPTPKEGPDFTERRP